MRCAVRLLWGWCGLPALGFFGSTAAGILAAAQPAAVVAGFQRACTLMGARAPTGVVPAAVPSARPGWAEAAGPDPGKCPGTVSRTLPLRSRSTARAGLSQPRARGYALRAGESRSGLASAGRHQHLGEHGSKIGRTVRLAEDAAEAVACIIGHYRIV